MSRNEHEPSLGRQRRGWIPSAARRRFLAVCCFGVFTGPVLALLIVAAVVGARVILRPDKTTSPVLESGFVVGTSFAALCFAAASAFDPSTPGGPAHRRGLIRSGLVFAQASLLFLAAVVLRFAAESHERLGGSIASTSATGGAGGSVTALMILALFELGTLCGIGALINFAVVTWAWLWNVE
jgi:hypothetical protein